ncbi:hypothetical protein [Pseudomonas sp. TCU-HL1]|uniref:hypothetical protein n=1 Tax=Pseudomonas sp. TCU-HL1 TaxID=1856685 RepID=UPI000856DCED|nr:hypothetical protein [Pseudomonas sp. TCU-HL1]AOE86806.1 hypothetical protein THL1_4258 [Pseudomonas sp. TCU-HL1]
MSTIHNKKTLYLRWLLLLSMGSIATAQAASQQDIQQLRTLSYSVIDNVLVYHNPQGRPFDNDNAETYRRDLQKLKQLSAQLGLSKVTAQAEQLEREITGLQNLPQSASDTRENIPPYSLWLPQVIQQHDLISTALAELYAEQPVASQAQRSLHNLSWDIERLSLSYQLSSFTQLVAQTWMLDDQAVAALDDSIRQRFSDLPQQHAELTDTLSKLQGRYHFVRGYVVKPGQTWAPNAVDRYLLGTARELDAAAGELVP